MEYYGNIDLTLIFNINILYSFHLSGIQLLTLLVPILFGFLLEPIAIKKSSKYVYQLHEQSLQWLMRIGLKYPQEFEALMSQSIELRTEWESAIRHNQQSTNQKHRTEAHSQKSQSNQSKPTIELKTNISNFSSNWIT